jgi:hypothetical protein
MPPDFEQAVAPILIRHCLACHNPSELRGGLDLTRRDGHLQGGETGPAIAPGDPDKSLLVKRVAAGSMPPKKSGAPLSAVEVAALRDWVKAGAPWPKDRVLSPFELTTDKRAGYDWWALQPLKDLAPPKPGPPEAGLRWARSPIDTFSLKRLNAAGLMPAPEADRRTLIRRATFDLLGLPPTPAEIDAFLSDASPDAYERLIDRLLASPHYGERWGRHWLDVARFGESDGFENDKLRDHAWRYRDYVLDSFNADKPYDLFIKEQLAGDALQESGIRSQESETRNQTPDSWHLTPERQRLIAPGFLVAGPWDEIQNVGVSKIEKARAHEEQVEEMIAAVSQTFLGLTVNCARCHDHKFDPIAQADYYRLKAVFDGVDHGNRSILTPAEERARQAKLAPLQARLNELRAELVKPSPQVTRELPADALTEGRFGKALDARRASITLPSLAALQTPPLTIECWTRLFSKSGFNILVANNLKESANHWELYSYAGSGEFSAYLPGYSPSEIKSGLDITDGRWHHVAMTFDGTRVRLHVDAKLARDQQVTRQKSDDKLGQLWIGAYPPQQIGCDGLVDEVRISKSLRAMERLPEGPFATDDQTLGLWHLDDRRAEGVSPPSTSASTSTSKPPSSAAREADAPRSPEVLKTEMQKLEAELAIHSPPMAYSGVRRQPPATHLLVRGDFQKPGELVKPGGIAAVRQPILAFELPADTPEAQRRLRFAEWVAATENPLTARVMVNRIWHYHFGQGLVDTPSDLGFNGGRPSHPELLDWLAREFIQSGWSVKHMHRLMMTSATYRQAAVSGQRSANSNALRRLPSSEPPKEPADSDNRLLSHFPARRLEAEIVRDAMLAVSGQLNPQLGGPSFRPFTVTVRNHNFYHLFDKDTPEFNRRTVYRMNVNTGKSPFLDALDCPAPSLTMPRRRSTVTPLAALALMNDSFALRQAERFAQRVKREASGDLQRQVKQVFRLALGREPTPEELQMSVKLASENGLEQVCWVLLNATEFLYVR